MSRASKMALGAATFLPILYVVVITVAGFVMFIMLVSSGRASDGELPGWYIGFLAPSSAVRLWVIGLTAFYIVGVFRDKMMGKDKKILWVLILILGNLFVVPLYWYLHVWREPGPPRAAASAFKR